MLLTPTSVPPWGAQWFGTVPDRINMLAPPGYIDYTFTSSTTQGWTTFNLKGGGEITPNATTAPDGTQNASKITESNGAGPHGMIQNINRSASVPITFRLGIFAKQAERTRIALQFYNATGDCTAVFDLAGVQVGVPPTVTGGRLAAVGASIQGYPNGWCKCLMDVTSTSDVATNFCVFTDAGSGTGAININYTGNNASGVYLWKNTMLPLGAWGIQGSVFFDDFMTTATIDMNDSLTAGFNWYRHNAWPSSPIAFGWQNLTATPTAAISVSNSILTLAYDVSGFGLGLAGVGYSPTAPGYVGSNLFQPPLLYEASLKFDPTLAIGSGNPSSAPVFWSNPTEFLTGATSTFVELDIQEEAATGAGTSSSTWSMHNWSANNLVSHRTDEGRFGPMAIDYSIFHRYSVLWLTQQANGGVYGYIMSFIDGVMDVSGDQTYGADVSPNPASLNGSPVGAFSVGETQHFAILLGAGGTAGYHWPLQVDWVQVFQANRTATANNPPFANAARRPGAVVNPIWTDAEKAIADMLIIRNT